MKATGVVSQTSQICRLTNYGGSFYLYVTSATVRNFAACAGRTQYGGTFDQLLSSDVQRR